MARWPVKKKKKSGSPRTDVTARPERDVPVPETDEPALETYLPERGEVFFEEEPKPFAVSLREILQEYRSDSSPSRYAMAVELGEADDWEEYLGPQTEEPEPIYPADERAVQDILHASWMDSHADEPDISLYPGPGSHLRGIDSAPYAEPASSAADGGYRAGSGPQLRDILSEYRDGPAEEAAPADRGHAPMTSMDAQPDTRPAAASAEPEDELPAGIRTLQDRRAEDFSARSCPGGGCRTGRGAASGKEPPGLDGGRGAPPLLGCAPHRKGGASPRSRRRAGRRGPRPRRGTGSACAGS